MNIISRPSHIEEALCTMHNGQWFTWTDSKNKIYANLRLTEKVGVDGNAVDNPITELPTEQECTDALTELQAEYDAQDYARKRKAEYPTIEELVVALYDTDDKAAIEAKRAEIKLKYPKNE